MPSSSSSPNPHVSPKPIIDIAMAFTASNAVLTAVKLDLFSTLNQPTTAVQLGNTLGLHSRAVPVFFDTLVSLGLLERSGWGADALYSNTPSSSTFLSKSSPRYIGTMFKFCHSYLYSMFGNLETAMRTGLPQNKADGLGGNIENWEKHYENEGPEMEFLAGIGAMNVLPHRNFAQKFDFTGIQTLLDLGGGSGLLCCEVAKANSEVKCISFDLPAVKPYALQNANQAGVSDKVQVIGGDFWVDDLPAADVVVMSMVLHDQDLEKKKQLLKRGLETLSEGGKLVSIEMYIDEERKQNTAAFMMSLAMLLETEGGFGYTAKEFDVWAKDVGFKRTEFMDLNGPIGACIAYK